MSTSAKRIVTVASILCALVLFVLFLYYRPPAKARALDPVIEELFAYKKKNGKFPTDPEKLQSVQALQKDYSLYFGKRISEDEVSWSPFSVSENDLSILVYDEGFTLFAPTERIKMISFSNFRVWRRTSEDSRWTRGKIHWSLISWYWDDD